MSFSKNSKDANGTPFSCAKHGDKNKKKSGNQNDTKNMTIYIWGAGGFAQKHGVGILVNNGNGNER